MVLNSYISEIITIIISNSKKYGNVLSLKILQKVTNVHQVAFSIKKAYLFEEKYGVYCIGKRKCEGTE